MQEAVWVRPNEIDKGKPEIEKAVASLMKQFPKLTVNVPGAGQHGNVVWYYNNYILAPNGPTGHSGVTLVSDGVSWRYLIHTTNITPPKQ
jgi:nitrate reductase NapE component